VADFVSIDGTRLEYAWHGPAPSQSPTLVFLHEGLGSTSQWRTFPADLSSRLGCSALVYSRCGHGKSDGLTAPRSIDFMHDEATTVLPRLLEVFEIRRPIVVGHSDGASIALIHAGSGAGDPFALILEAPHVFVEDVTVTRIAELRDQYRTTDLRTKLARHHGENVDALFQSWTDVWLSPGFRTWNIEHYLPGVTCPTLVIQGRQDEYGTDRQVNTLVSALGGRCEGIMLDRCGHAPHVDQRATVENIMSSFVRGLE
jgi:pimeloyl-ACP methyl ester carboxylesterase